MKMRNRKHSLYTRVAGTEIVLWGWMGQRLANYMFGEGYT